MKKLSSLSKQLTIISFITILCTASLSAQKPHRPGPNGGRGPGSLEECLAPNPRTISVSGSGSVKVPADMAAYWSAVTDVPRSFPLKTEFLEPAFLGMMMLSVSIPDFHSVSKSVADFFTRSCPTVPPVGTPSPSCPSAPFVTVNVVVVLSVKVMV